MSERIRCRDCKSPDCRGRNIYTLAIALERGHFDSFMDGNRAVHILADVHDGTPCGMGRKLCATCVCGDGGCLAALTDDYYAPATKEQVLARLSEGRYKEYVKEMKNYLEGEQNVGNKE